MTRLLTRLFRPRQSARHLTFTVYSRARCCCCHNAIELLEAMRRRYGFHIQEVDIDADPDLLALYDTEVPVVAVNGKVRFRGAVNPFLLERLLQAESQNSGGSSIEEER